MAYTYVPLHNIGGDDHTWAGYINAAGQTAGYSDVTKNADVSDAVVWSTSGQATVLSNTNGNDSYVNALNNKGQTVGESFTDGKHGGPPPSVLWSASGQVTVLQDPAGHDNDWVKALNNSGESVGYSAAPHYQDAVRWSPTGKATVLQDIGDLKEAEAVGINGSGWCIGWAAYLTKQDYESFIAVLWNPSGQGSCSKVSEERA
jgi:hypothetical protein